MKRLKRTPEKFEVLDLFTALGTEQGYRLDVDQDVDSFLTRIGEALKTYRRDQRLIFGKRTEALFAHVAGTLGACSLVKHEDSGQVLYLEEDLQPPDYKLILKNGEQIFVEVKNWHQTDLSEELNFDPEYIDRLDRYAQLHDVPLKVAIYLSRLGVNGH